MSYVIHSNLARPTAPFAVKFTVGVVLAAWFALIFALGAAQVFVGPPGKPPIPIALGFVVPLLVFFGALRLSPSFRQFVLNIDARVILAMQAWRFAGLGFLALQVHGLLPAHFALPAGLGDIAIGMTAPFIANAIIKRPAFVASKWFVAWNVLGILDLVDA